MSWFQSLPEKIAFVDVETTGLAPGDRIVSLGAFWIATGSLCDHAFPVSFVHLIFNPRRPNHPRAAQVHGYSDWLLQHQEPFELYADCILDFLYDADLLVAHNAEFDIGFINAELRRIGRPTLDRPSFCTMTACHDRGVPAKLDLACKRIGLRRVRSTHDALEDAWFAMMLYLSLHGCHPVQPFAAAGALLEPFNFRTAPEAPEGTIAASVNTGRSIAGMTKEAARIDTLVHEVNQLKREGLFQQAEALLVDEINRQEVSASLTGGVAPWYYNQLAIIYSKQHRFEDELSILERYAGQPKAPGVMPTVLAARLGKARARFAVGVPASLISSQP